MVCVTAFSAMSLNGVAVAVPGPDGVCAVAARQHVSKTAPASKDITIVCGSCVFLVVSWQEGLKEKVWKPINFHKPGLGQPYAKSNRCPHRYCLSLLVEMGYSNHSAGVY